MIRTNKTWTGTGPDEEMEEDEPRPHRQGGEIEFSPTCPRDQQLIPDCYGNGPPWPKPCSGSLDVNDIMLLMLRSKYNYNYNYTLSV